MKGKLENGFEWEFPDTRLDNMELIDALEEMTEMEETNNFDPFVISKSVKLLLGKDLRNKLYNHIRREDGTVPMEETMKCFVEIIESQKDSKN